MNINVVEIQPGDTVLIQMDIGNVPPAEVDAMVKKQLPLLKETFGCPITVFPIRGCDWAFTIIRNKNRKAKVKKLRK